MSGAGTTPSLAPLLARLAASEEIAALERSLDRDAAAALVHVPHPAKAELVAALSKRRRVAWIARDPEVAERIATMLRSWFDDADSVLLLEPRSALPFERGELVVDESAGRVATLAAWLEGAGASGAAAVRSDASGARVIVASLLAAMQPTVASSEVAAGALTLRPGDRIALDDVVRRAIALGYVAAPLVGARGEIARRGGIVDIFPAGATQPMRIEWIGDEVESLRDIDPSTQRSGEHRAAIRLLPASEFPLGAARVAAARREAERLAALDGASLPPRLGDDLARWEASLAAASARAAGGEAGGVAESGGVAEPGDGLEIWGPILAPARALDEFGGALVVLDEPAELLQIAAALARGAEERRDALRTTRLLPKGWPSPFPSVEVVTQLLANAGASRLEVTWSSEAGRIAGVAAEDPFHWHDPVVPSGRSRALAEGLDSWRRDGARVVIVSEQAPRLAELFGEAGESTPIAAMISGDPRPGSITLIHGGLDGGVQGGIDGLTIITDRELFGATRVRRAAVHRRGITREAAERLSPDDHLVHVDHGVGRFVGMVRRGDAGEERDYLEIEYGGGDRVYTPVEQLGRIARYTGAEHPHLSRLGGGEWRRAKERAKRAADDLADELLRIYAARELARRAPIAPGSPWLAEFEAAFPYRETVDQLAAIEATKGDLARDRPMDRVIVGDVGYGKTEVALRAVFATLEAGRQAALLVPTTVLALQHLETFQRRMAAYPFRIALLSRSVSTAEQARVAAGLADGSVDLVIATHRLLSKDVAFKHLGLLVVDEEHRFGVAAKERLKALREQLDVLTLTATPIPRTLNLALSGIRDLSTIETPPEDRHPVATRVAEASLELVRDALLREIERGGQAYYVHNRVESIEAAAEQLRGLLPDARIAVGHGQMPERALEKAMAAFVRGEVDILVCTTIIESGLDIPNANTIVVDRADRLGLAQLYQLRGRVGRSSRRAWCYLLYRHEDALSDVARRRLKAIFDAAHLGAGFQLALADLEIRGAGDLLGGEQSGHIAAVGFDLYSQLLAESVEARRAEHEGRTPVRRRQVALLDLPIAAHLPNDYVEEEGQRLDLYRRLGGAASVAAVDSLAAELRDRYGAPPRAAERLLEVARLRVVATDAGIAGIAREEGLLIVRLGDLPRGVAARALAAAQAKDVAGRVRLHTAQIRSVAPLAAHEAWDLAVELVAILSTEAAGWSDAGDRQPPSPSRKLSM